MYSVKPQTYTETGCGNYTLGKIKNFIFFQVSLYKMSARQELFFAAYNNEKF